MIKEEKRSFLSGALTLTAGLFLAKILGAVYRIPLTNLLGTYGIGVYQLIFPLYSLFLTLATAGIPTAISKTVAEKIALGRQSEALGVFKASLLFLGGIGTASAILLFLSAPLLGKLQNNPDAVTAYRIISAGIPLCAVSAAFRGYFNGSLNMRPSSVSQIAEQAVKLLFGLLAVMLCLPDVLKAVYAAALAVVAAEGASLLIMAIWFKRSAKPLYKVPMKIEKGAIKQLVTMSVPLTMTAVILPALHFIDSFLFQNLITAQNATELYGLWSGPVHSLISMPSVLTLGIAAAIVPGIAKAVAVNDNATADCNLNSALKMAFFITLPAAVGLMLFAKPIGVLLYPGLNEQELRCFVSLLQLAAPGVVSMTLLMITSSALQAYGSPYIPVLSLTAAAVVKLALGAAAYSNIQIGVYGESISDAVAYTVACCINLLYVLKVKKCKLKLWEGAVHPLAGTCVMSLFVVIMTGFCGAFVQTALGTVVTILAAATLYGATTLFTGFVNPSEVKRYLTKNRA